MILNPWQLSQCLCVNTMNRVPRKWEVGGKDKEWLFSADCAHLDAFVITTVCFLRVQIYKTDLRETKRERQNIRVTAGVECKVSHMWECCNGQVTALPFPLPFLFQKPYKPDWMTDFFWVTFHLNTSYQLRNCFIPFTSEVGRLSWYWCHTRVF